MRGSLTWVIVLGAVVGAVHLAAHDRGARGTAGATKAVPIALLLWWVLGCETTVGETYRRLVAVGLVFSMGGDLLLLARERFRAGLASFFVAQVLYLAAFATAPGALGALPGTLAAIVVAGGVMLRVLWPHVGAERGPVAAYLLVISLMASVAVARALAPATPQPSGLFAAVGALVFMASDGVLALDRFVRPWRGAHAAVMVTYYAAQMLIASSVAA